MIRFLTELLVRQTWFGQFDELYFFLTQLLSSEKWLSLLPNLMQNHYNDDSVTFGIWCCSGLSSRRS